MAKLLYCIKICLFEKQLQELPPGTITTKHQVPKVTNFVQFVTLIYCPWWSQSSCSVDAPWNDLVLYHNLLKYQQVNQVVAKSALKALDRHLWYLTAELVPLALFSSKVPSIERQKLADTLLDTKPEAERHAPHHRHGTGFGKPKFSKEVGLQSKLADFVTEDSWFFFSVLKLDSSFLHLDVAAWPEADSFKTSLANVTGMNVINDAAERGVKLSSDFMASARTEEHYQNVLQVVEADRASNPNLRKKRFNFDN